jgi:hypothetical protein
VNAEFDLCDECKLPMPPSDCYSVGYTTLEMGPHGLCCVSKHYPGAFHGACTSKAKERLDAERSRKAR